MATVPSAMAQIGFDRQVRSEAGAVNGSAAVNAVIGGAGPTAPAGVRLVDLCEVGLPQQTLPRRGGEVPQNIHWNWPPGHEFVSCLGREDEAPR